VNKKALLGLNINILLLGIVSFLNDVSSEIIMPVLPFFIVSLGGTGIALGLIGGLEESVSGVLKIFSGYWSDKTGKKKAFVSSGYGVSAVAKLFLPFSTVWQHVLVIKPIERVGKGLRSAPRDALISEYSDQKSRGLAFGVHRALDSAGAVLGSIIAFLLIWFFTLDLRQVLIIAAVLAFLALIPLIFVKERKKEPKSISLKISLKGLPRTLKIYILIGGLFTLGNFSYMFFIVRASLFFSPEVSYIIPLMLYILFNVIYTFLSIPFGALSDKVGRKKVICLGYGLFSLTCILFMFSNSLPMFLLSFAVYGVVMAALEGNQRAYVSDLATREEYGTALGAFQTTTSLISLPAGAIAGIILEIVGWEALFLFGMVMGILAAIMLATLRK